MRRIAVHTAGDADVGLTRPDADARRRRVEEFANLDDEELLARFGGFDPPSPVMAFFDWLAEPGTPPVDDLIVVATSREPGATRELVPLIERVADARGVVCRPIVIPEPVADHGRLAVAKYVHETAPLGTVSWIVNFASGATGIALGCAEEAMLRGEPLAIWTPEGGASPLEPNHQIVDQAPARWLVRGRYYDAMATLARHGCRGDEAEAWKKLHAWQAVDVADLLASAPDAGPDPGDEAERRKRELAVVREAVHAAFAEGLARGEITDGAAARQWLKDLVALHYEPRDEVGSSKKDGNLDRDFWGRVRRSGTEKAALLTFVSEPLHSLVEDDVVAAEVLEWRRRVIQRSHGALDVDEPDRLPDAVRKIQEEWAIRHRREHPVLASYPEWPVVPRAGRDRRIVLIRALRSPNPWRRDEELPVIIEEDRVLLDELADTLASDHVVSYELTTDPAVFEARRPGEVRRLMFEVPDPDKDPHRAEEFRAEFLKALRGELRPVVDTEHEEQQPDRAGEQAELARQAELADEVAVLLPPGRKALALGALLAAVDWSLHCAAPLTLLVAYKYKPGGDRSSGLRSAVRVDATRAAATLGLDSALARVARSAIESLHLSLAADLLRRGSPPLRALAERASELHRDAFGILPPAAKEKTAASEVAFALARLRLCRRLVAGGVATDLRRGGNADTTNDIGPTDPADVDDRPAGKPWDAPYTAVSVLDHTFRMPAQILDVEGLGTMRTRFMEGWLPAELAEEKRPKCQFPGQCALPDDCQARDTCEVVGWAKAPERFYLAPWHRLRIKKGSACKELRLLRNEHPLSHGLDGKKTDNKWAGWKAAVPEPTDVVPLLERAEQELAEELERVYPDLSLADAGALERRLDDLLAEIDSFVDDGADD